MRWTPLAILVHAVLLAVLDAYRSGEEPVKEAVVTMVAEPISIDFIQRKPTDRAERGPKVPRFKGPARATRRNRRETPPRGKQALDAKSAGIKGLAQESLIELTGSQVSSVRLQNNLLEASEPTSSRHGKKRRWRPNRRGGLDLESNAIQANIKNDGSISFEEKPLLEWNGGTTFTQRFDEWLMRKAGVDPYLSNKLAVLEETRDMRIGMIKAWNVKNTARQVEALPSKLTSLWMDETRTLQEKKGLLFLLWDECLESGAGKRARERIETFVQKNGIDFSEKELEEMNRTRTSAEKFRP